ncbi:MAG: CheY-like chemotaxis protein/HPt (histidine-containing phosphotransfer) domain-containing protein, partial [Patescibacteria group bacterium]
LCNELNNILSLEAQKKGVSLLCVCPPSLPEFLIGDQTRLYQLFINLLNNAIKFTHVGYIALHIFLLEKTDEKVDLQFEIRDTGIGIKKDRLNKIFNSFTQVHEDTETVYEGAGLGLNIVKNIVTIMGGSIEVNSAVNKGTSFFVNLSFNIPTEEEVAIHLKEKTNLQIPKHWTYKKLLLIEDNKANLLYAKNIFLDWGIKLTTAETIAEANAKIEAEQFDCILSDVKLPDGNGLAFIKDLREQSGQQNQHTPIIVLTASSNEKEAHYAKSIKVQSYIGKPFSQELLIQELTKVLDEPIKKEKLPLSPILEPVPQNQHSYFTTLNRNFPNKNNYKMEILDIFLEQIPNTLNAMEQSIKLDDLETFYFEAHNIKSTINNIGLPKLQPLISKIDEYCYKKIHTDQLPSLFEAFKQTAMEDIQILLKERERLKEAA